MTTFRKSVPKPTRVGAGAPNPKKGDVTIVFADDIISYPERDANGVQMLGNIVLKAGAKMHKLYETPTSQKASHTIEGDEDAEQFKLKFEGMHPGDSLEINEFIQNVLGQGLVIIYGTSCGSNSKKVLGTPCNPMKLKGEFTDDKDGVKHTLNFEQYQGDSNLAGFYTGTLSFAEPFAVALATAIALTPENGNIYQLPATAAEADATITSLTLSHGQVVSLVGSGGAGPVILESGASTAANVLLRDGTTWIALKDGVINLQVFNAGVTKYLIEVSRS